MKRALLISLSLNIALLLLTMRQSHALRIPPRIPRVGVGNSVTRSLRMGLAPALRGTSVTPWGGIDSPDPATFIANLRRLGCPEATIRDIVVLRLGRKYRNELLLREAEAARSWDYTKYRTDWRERLEQQQELRDKMQTELERILGQNWISIASSTMGWSFRAMDTYSFVADERRQQLREVERQYNRLKVDLERQQSRSQWVAPDNTPLVQLEKEHQADLSRILSPQEVIEYFYRFSPAAKYVRDSLPEAKNESEFRTMVEVAQQFDLWNQPALSFSQRYGLPTEPGVDNDTNTDAAAAEYAARKAAFDTRLKEVLGADRIAQQRTEELARAEELRKQEAAASLERERDEIAAVATSVGVATEDANRFFDRLKELEPELSPKFEKFEKDFKGTGEERTKAMKAAIKAELERIATEFMGDKAHAFVEKMDK
jgi:hypothetical protein